MHADREPIPWEEALNQLAYPVWVGVDARLKLSELAIPFDRVVCLADANVLALHGKGLPWLKGIPVEEIPPGETSKDWPHLERVVDFLADQQCSRRSLLVTLGGGVTSDLGGLAASLFKRGMAVAHLPTTLLAQVDASIGSKTAINLRAGKNLVGTFHAPKFVLIDPTFLLTLPRTEWLAGLGEVIKTCLLGRPSHWKSLQALAPDLAAGLEATGPGWVDLIRECVRVKAQWVALDPEENGSRKALNLGHTFGHAIECAAGFGVVPHGVAVAMGLRLAMKASERLGWLEAKELPAELDATLSQVGLPLSWLQWPTSKHLCLDVATLQAGLKHDKKGSVGAPQFVLPSAVGRVQWDAAIPEALLTELWSDFLSEGIAENDR